MGRRETPQLGEYAANKKEEKVMLLGIALLVVVVLLDKNVVKVERA